VSEEIKLQYKNATINLNEKDKGIFDVEVDGKIIFSKYQENRFPNSNEIIELISNKIK
jgi:selT/selW/selH-like putative selenoprotein|tara:strand:- start:352 stop:525 length:174 start_codon:yes stop_codon:yes gene_type:complete